MAHYDIFSAQLAVKYPAYGHALWVPGPVTLECPVEVGDVGFIREGRFHRLFNALLPADHPSHNEPGVPEHYEPLIPSVSGHIFNDILSPSHYSSLGVDVVTDELDVRALGPDDFSRITVLCQRKRVGAVSSVPVRAQRQDTLARGDFAKWMVKHIDTWFAFARGLGFGIEHMEEIVFVTGRDRTKSWTNAVFLGCQADAQVSFGVRVDEGSGDSIEWQLSPGQIGGAILTQGGPGGNNLPENQCIFIRGFRASRAFGIFPKHLKAAAERPDGDEEDGDEEDGRTGPGTRMEVISVPSVRKSQDPLHTLFEYVADHASECDTVLVHDEDLALISGTCKGNFPEIYQPNFMKSYLERSNPKIYEVSWDLSSARNAEKRVIKVAMLSNVSNKSRQLTSGYDAVNRTRYDPHPFTMNDTMLGGSPSNTFSQYRPPQAHPTSPFTATPVPQEQFYSSAPSESFDRRGLQSPVALNVPPHPVEQPRSGLDGLPSPSEHPEWDNKSGGVPHQVSRGHLRDYTDIDSSAKPRRTSYGYDLPPAPPNDAPDFSPQIIVQYCRIPGCRNKASYDFAEQEQTEYCGQGHELQAMSTGLVNRCAMCKGRPRRIGERFCGRTCRERERQTPQVQGSYYGVPVVRREPRTGPGASSG